MNHDQPETSNPAETASAERPIYKPPVLIDCGTFAGLTRGGGGLAGSDSWGAGGAGGGS